EPGRAANPQSLPTIHFIGLNDTVNGRPAEPDAITVSGVLAHLGLSVREVDAGDTLGIEKAASQADTPVIVVADSVLDPRLEALNQLLLERRGPGWVLVRPRGTVTMLGPHFRPDETGCWE